MGRLLQARQGAYARELLLRCRRTHTPLPRGSPEAYGVRTGLSMTRRISPSSQSERSATRFARGCLGFCVTTGGCAQGSMRTRTVGTEERPRDRGDERPPRGRRAAPPRSRPAGRRATFVRLGFRTVERTREGRNGHARGVGEERVRDELEIERLDPRDLRARTSRLHGSSSPSSLRPSRGSSRGAPRGRPPPQKATAAMRGGRRPRQMTPMILTT